MSSGNGIFLTGSPNAPKLVVFCPSGLKKGPLDATLKGTVVVPC